MAKLSKLILKPQFTLSRSEGGHYSERGCFFTKWKKNGGPMRLHAWGRE
jgi:hypothetical protein